jgi:hypothetical protein
MCHWSHGRRRPRGGPTSRFCSRLRTLTNVNIEGADHYWPAEQAELVAQRRRWLENIQAEKKQSDRGQGCALTSPLGELLDRVGVEERGRRGRQGDPWVKPLAPIVQTPPPRRDLKWTATCDCADSFTSRWTRLSVAHDPRDFSHPIPVS